MTQFVDIKGYSNMQSDDFTMEHDQIEITQQAIDILKSKHKSKLKPLNPEIIHPQQHYTKIILNAFQCLLQAQVSVLIHEYNVKPHLYNIVGQIWFRFLNTSWIKKGFGCQQEGETEEQSQTLWVWNKNANKALFEESGGERAVICSMLVNMRDPRLLAVGCLSV